MKLNHNIKHIELTNRVYDRDFRTSKEYEATLPDIQNQDYHGTTPIEWVGMAGIRRPLTLVERSIETASGTTQTTQTVEAYIIGQVDCESEHRGINMSRLNRELHTFDTETFNLNKLEDILNKYQTKLERVSAMITINFQWRQWQEALRTYRKGEPETKEGGWQYYNVTFDLIKQGNEKARKFITIDYIYSSHCPCSTELSDHAAYSRGVKASPHAQRSIARLKVELNNEMSSFVYIEDLIDLLRQAIPSQVQIFVKRVDEQAFAELCAAEGTIFVEDAIRLIDKQINRLVKVTKQVVDYKIICNHMESLHPWGAHSVRVMEGSKFEPWVTIADIKDMNRICGN